MRTLRLANLRGRCAFGDNDQDVVAENERCQLRVNRSSRRVEVLSERTQVEHGPIRTKKTAEHGLQIPRALLLFEVERTQLRGLAHARMDRLRAFEGHQVDMQGLSALSLGEFGDV